MFSKGREQEATKGSSSGESTTLIAQGTSLKGDLDFHGILEVHCSISLIITSDDENSHIRVILGGSVYGNISVATLLVNSH